jgi:hypothetical protein
MILLTCVLEKRKLRIRFHCFINEQNEIYNNVYNNEYNCMFPKDMRTLGAFYKVNDGSIKLTVSEKKGPYYSIKRSQIEVITKEQAELLMRPEEVDISTIKIFDAGECVIFLSSASTIVFLPCAHRCTCAECARVLKNTKHSLYKQR